MIVGGFCEAVGVTDRQPPRSLLGDDQLPASAVVANCAMNWERQLTGVYSYTRELGFNPTRVDTATAATTASTVAITAGRVFLAMGTNLHGRFGRMSTSRTAL